MRVLFLTKYYPPTNGGIERYGHMLCTELLARGIEVVVVAALEEGGSSRVEKVDGIKVHRLQVGFNISSTPITFGLPGLLKGMAGTFDIIHINFPNPWTDLLYLVQCRAHKVVLTYHSDIFRSPRTLSFLLLRMYHMFVRRVLANVDAIIASSPDLVAHSPFLSRVSAKCRVIPMPADVKKLRRTDFSESTEDFNHFGKFVLFVGRFVIYKGVHHLIEAMSLVSDASLVIVGDGPLKQDYERLVCKLGLQERVFFVGEVSDERLRMLYHACRCLVLPSVSHAEGFGMVLAEAMACGKPVISTQLNTGTSYVNLDGITGYVVPPRDPVVLANRIELLLRDDETYQRLAQGARNRAETEFDRSAVVDRTLKVYREVLESVAENNKSHDGK